MGSCVMSSANFPPRFLSGRPFHMGAQASWCGGEVPAVARVKFGGLGISRKWVLRCAYGSIEFDERNSPSEIRREIESCYNLIQKLGRGVVYLGSSRFNANHPHYLQAMELGSEVAKLLNCTTWTGAGPGLMDAVIKGALSANKPVGGFKIGKEAGEWSSSNFHPYLPQETYLTCSLEMTTESKCRFFSARKHGLVDAAVRNRLSDMTAVVALPGGVGTLDEVFEILALMQLKRLGTELPVPFLVMNYDSFYSKLFEFLDECKQWGVVGDGEVDGLWKVCDNNAEALDYLADFYRLPQRGRHGAGIEYGVVS